MNSVTTPTVNVVTRLGRLLTVGLLTSTILSAQGAEVPVTTPDGKKYDKTTPMKITGFDKQVAASHGYEILTDQNGKEYSLRIGDTRLQSQGAQVTPSNVVSGNCGYSWIYYDAIGDSAAQINTGFVVDQPATSYWWLVTLDDAGGHSAQTWAGGLFFRNRWGVTRTVRHMTHGHSDAKVSTASSAILWDGAVCTSGGPEDFTWVY